VGPTGVGKTEFCVLFASYFFGADPFARFDMAEYKELTHITIFRDRVVSAWQAGALRWLIENGINEKYGARPLLALMSRELEGALGRELIVRPVGTKIKGRFVPQTAIQALNSRLELKASAKLYTSEEA
jgi:ATP-dependent Clp protease ATP-binding subunit ClpA